MGVGVAKLDWEGTWGWEALKGVRSGGDGLHWILFPLASASALFSPKTCVCKIVLGSGRRMHG